MLHSSSTICSEQYAADWCVVRVDRSSRRGRCSEHRVTYVTSRGETTHKSSGGSRWVTPPLLRQRTTLSSQYSYIIHKCREKLQWPKSALLANWPSPRPCPPDRVPYLLAVSVSSVSLLALAGPSHFHQHFAVQFKLPNLNDLFSNLDKNHYPKQTISSPLDFYEPNDVDSNEWLFFIIIIKNTSILW